MRNFLILKERKAQTAVEYLLLLTSVVAIVLIGFRTTFPSLQKITNLYYNRVAVGIMGNPPGCGDGLCSFHEDCERCPPDCGPC